MTAPRDRAGQFAKVTPADAVIEAACAEVIITLQLATTEGRDAGRGGRGVSGDVVCGGCPGCHGLGDGPPEAVSGRKAHPTGRCLSVQCGRCRPDPGPVVLDLEDAYFDGQTLPDALRAYAHVHSVTGVCVKNVHGPLCETAPAEATGLRERVEGIRRYGQSKALSARARGNGDEERRWLDLLINVDAALAVEAAGRDEEGCRHRYPDGTHCTLSPESHEMPGMSHHRHYRSRS